MIIPEYTYKVCLFSGEMECFSTKDYTVLKVNKKTVEMTNGFGSFISFRAKEDASKEAIKYQEKLIKRHNMILTRTLGSL